jgi:hypothetical protein
VRPPARASPRPEAPPVSPSRSGWSTVGAAATGGALEALSIRDERPFAHRFGRGAIRIVREDARRVLPLLRSGFAVVLGHPVKWLGTWAVNAALWALALALYLAFRREVPAGTGLLVLVMAVAQQVFVLTRAWLRVTLLGSEIALVERLRPSPALAAAPAKGPQAVPEPEPPAA